MQKSRNHLCDRPTRGPRPRVESRFWRTTADGQEALLQEKSWLELTANHPCKTSITMRVLQGCACGLGVQSDRGASPFSPLLRRDAYRTCELLWHDIRSSIRARPDRERNPAGGMDYSRDHEGERLCEARRV